MFNEFSNSYIEKIRLIFVQRPYRNTSLLWLMEHL